jgi:short-subunit dehydrogenase
VRQTTSSLRDATRTGVLTLPICFDSRVLETPEDVAKAIWNGVQHQQADVIVGTAKLWTAMFHLFPGLMKSITRRVFGMKERV